MGLYAVRHAAHNARFRRCSRRQPSASSRVGRRQQQEMMGRTVWMLAPEDLILAKLLWYRASGLATQLRDCIGIWKVQSARLGLNYLRRRPGELGLDDLLDQVVRA